MMYRVKFTIGDNDVIRCRINRGMEYEYLDLEQQSIHNILNELAFAHEEINNVDDNYSYVTFENINESELKYLIDLELQREQEIRQEQENKRRQKLKAKEEKRQKERKVKRKNFYKRTVIVVSLVTATSLIAIANHKGDIIQNPAYEGTDEIVYVDTVDNDDKNEFDEKYTYDTPTEIDEGNVEVKTEDNNLENIQNNNTVENVETLELDVEENTQNEKYLYCKNNYGDLITKYANMYGIDPNLAIAVFTHERGYHSETMDPGGAIGLCQVQLDVWNNHNVTAFNFETNKMESYLIKEENIKNVEENIKAGVRILQDSLRQVSYVVLQGVQNYNYGLGNLNVAFRKSGLNSEQLNEQNNKDWMQYRDLIKGGDPQYIEHVFQYIPSGTTLHFKTPDGRQINLQYVAEKNMAR